MQDLIKEHTREFNRSFVGKEIDVLIDKPGNGKNRLSGRSAYLQSVHMDGSISMVGEIIKAAIDINEDFHFPENSKNLIFLFENGIIQQKNHIISIRGPSMNLDKNGFFKVPKESFLKRFLAVASSSSIDGFCLPLKMFKVSLTGIK
mgnify:CR=1 FL=1